VINGTKCTLKSKPVNAVAKAAYIRKKNLPTSKVDFSLRKKIIKCYIWRIALYGAQTWTLRKVKDKSVPLHSWRGPQGSRKLRFPDFMTTGQNGGKVVNLTHRPLLPPGNAPGTHFC